MMHELFIIGEEDEMDWIGLDSAVEWDEDWMSGLR